jgi:hypothetical protein
MGQESEDIAHDWILQSLNGEQVDTTGASLVTLSIWDRYQQFIAYHHPEILGASLLVHSEMPYPYTEIIDFYWRFDGALTLGLVETQLLIPPDLAICLAGAAHAQCVVDPDQGTLPMLKWEKLAILHVRPSHAELLEVGHVDTMYQAYVSGTPYPDVHRSVVVSTGDLAKKYLM